MASHTAQSTLRSQAGGAEISTPSFPSWNTSATEKSIQERGGGSGSWFMNSAGGRGSPLDGRLFLLNHKLLAVSMKKVHLHILKAECACARSRWLHASFRLAINTTKLSCLSLTRPQAPSPFSGSATYHVVCSCFVTTEGQCVAHTNSASSAHQLNMGDASQPCVFIPKMRPCAIWSCHPFSIPMLTFTPQISNNKTYDAQHTTYNTHRCTEQNT